MGRLQNLHTRELHCPMLGVHAKPLPWREGLQGRDSPGGRTRVGLLDQTVGVASRFRWPDRPSISFVPSQLEVTDGSEVD